MITGATSVEVDFGVQEIDLDHLAKTLVHWAVRGPETAQQRMRLYDWDAYAYEPIRELLVDEILEYGLRTIVARFDDAVQADGSRITPEIVKWAAELAATFRHETNRIVP